MVGAKGAEGGSINEGRAAAGGVARPDPAAQRPGKSLGVKTVQGKVGKARMRGKSTIDRHRQQTSDWAHLGYFFIEVFSGSEGVARQLGAQGVKVYTFDKIHDMLGLAFEVAATWDQVDLPNLACMEVIARIYQLIEKTQVSSGMCLGVFAGIECTSFSVCHTNQLRTKLFPAGRPDLEGKRLDKVILGSLLVRAGSSCGAWGPASDLKNMNKFKIVSLMRARTGRHDKSRPASRASC